MQGNYILGLKGKNTLSRLFFVLVIMVCSFTTQAQLTVVGSQTANDLAQMLAGNGVTVTNAVFSNCELVAEGKFWVTPPNVSNLGIDSGIVLTSGTAQTGAPGIGVNSPAGVNTTSHISNFSDVDLATLAGFPSRDACVLEFDFIPLGDTVKFDYVFGSCEYPDFTCSSFNDVFGFFINGPGITGPFTNNSKNIAIVPTTTNCPVGVNTVNLPTPGGNCCNTNTICYNATPPCATLTAAQMAAFFVCNGAGTTVMYPGFTSVFTAYAVTVPCSTYHLKLAVCDASDQALDSGVFLKAGSLSSNSITISAISNLVTPYPYIVEGCAAGFIKIQQSTTTPFPYTFNYTVGGVATYPADYNVSTIPPGAPFGQVTIPAGDSVAYLAISALQDGLNEGLEEIKIYAYAPCSNNIVDSVSLFINDSIIMNIITPDTAICAEDSVHILVNGSDSLQYTWTPVTNINNPAIKEPTVSPNFNTSYVVCATLPLAGCAPTCDTIDITINQPPNVFISNDTIICKDMVIQFNPVITPAQTYTYTWGGTGVGFLSGNNIPNPIGTFTNQGNFDLTLHVEPQAAGCAGDDTINIRVLPNDITLHNGDTSICKGGEVQINVTGDPLFSYNWTPSTYLNNPTLEDPLSIPDTSIVYTVTASFPGCIPMIKSFSIDVQPNPIVNVGPDREICDWDTLQLQATVIPAGYPFYTFTWTPALGLTNPNTQNTVFNGHLSGNYQLIVSTPVGCKDSDMLAITVHPVEFAFITPEESRICPNNVVQFQANGGVSYVWTPGIYLSDSLIGNPVASPIADIDYTVYSTSNVGCTDTDIIRIQIVSDALIDAGDDVTLYPGETTQLYAAGNCSFFTWTPTAFLSDSKIQNPIANPPVTTQYFVTGTTEYGCEAIDSVTIRISPESILDLPNAFSPGSGTSINDELRIIVKGVATLNYFRVYNRWGELVFETNDINKGWNGQYKGKSQPMGVYVYVLDAFTSTGKKIFKQGNITLIR
ncbi:MAG: gliding motility-associated C-terminal domain-containing protein [Bacteroidetes bacterium]|nr:gliding motility-associated C-terminal domain-containing protein [Bacteroidota bacterium]